MEGMAVAMFHKACTRLPTRPPWKGVPSTPTRSGSTQALGGGRAFDGQGLTREQALERAEGIQTIWIDELADAPPPTFANRRSSAAYPGARS